MTLKLRPASQASIELVEAAVELLHAQWARGGSVADYRAKLVGGDRHGGSGAPSAPPPPPTTRTTLPQSYLLIKFDDRGEDSKKETVVAHGRLTECFEGAGGSAAALTYILAEPRGRGYGTQLIKLLEDEAVKLGYHYLYLWTTTAVPFYDKLGYKQTERVSLYSACLKKLECEQVNQLEAMLHNKMGILPTRKKETVMLPPDAATQNDVWMRKRLVECVGSELIPVDERRNEIRAAVALEGNDKSLGATLYEYFLLQIPWQQQVGPSCGLAALRMLRDHYLVIDDTATRMPSLLTEAQQKGYSVDGEIFDAMNLVRLATFCGLQAELNSLRQWSPGKILSILQQGGTLILPYDSQPFTKRPCCNAGKSAHYGIVVGIVFRFDRNIGDDEETAPASGARIQPLADSRNVQDPVECWLLVQHSLSRKLSIATWSVFFESNQQLLAVDSTKFSVDRLNLSDCVIVCQGTASKAFQPAN